jgi:BirA family transcriptional regulator, biotin operon repressor / biotin---[acetyl-CoA-carboxylase] ligase
VSSQEQTKAMRDGVDMGCFLPGTGAGYAPATPAGIRKRRIDRKRRPGALTATEGLPPLPSLFAPVMLREGGDAFARAVELAPAEGPFAPHRGAGTLVWVRAYARAEAAVVLEPELPLGAARLAVLAAANALADALAADAPPDLPLTWSWPTQLSVNGGTVGGLRWAAPPGTAEDAVPEWLVVGYTLRLAWPEATVPGEHPGETALAEEGFEGLTPALLAHGWARHLMANLDEWQARGPGRVADRFLARLTDPGPAPGLRRGVDPVTAALVLDEAGARAVRPLDWNRFTPPGDTACRRSDPA